LALRQAARQVVYDLPSGKGFEVGDVYSLLRRLVDKVQVFSGVT
jgi:hypothetical protein